MDEAATREGDQVSLLRDPPGQLERPFARPSDLEALLAGEDDAAVDDADDERRDSCAVVTATIASSRSARPSGTRPARTSMWPWA